MSKVLVIGGGLMGSSAAWKLAERGANVTLVEQQSENYLHGSSYGSARIARSLGPKKDIFSYLHNQTVKEVSRLVDFLNTDNYGARHQMEDIYSTSPVSYLYHRDQWDKIAQLRFKKQKGDYRLGSSRSAFRKFGMTIPDDTLLVREYRQHSGTMNPTELIRKLQLGIAQKGSQVKYNRLVTRLVKKGGRFEVTITNLKKGKTRTVQFDRVVVASGAYTVDILKDFAPYLNRVITPKKVVISCFRIKQQRYDQLTVAEKEAVFNAQPFFSQIGKEYYSMIKVPEEDGASPLFKAGGHQLRRNIRDLNRIWTEKPRKKDRKWAKKQFRKHFEMLEIYLTKKDVEVVETYNCVYAETRNQVPLVTKLLNKYGSLDPNIVMIGGMSGIGAKGCLAYGAIGADLLLGKKGEVKKMYRKTVKALGNPSVRLYTRRVKRGRLF
jgi:glycine/D-amino acid oxidase-like deaminating enzyme